ncbi:MAG: proline dehydrogenase family protein [Candidatus Acidiferrales bacterium]
MLLRDFILWLSTKKRLTDFLARRGMRSGFARRFVAGERLEDAVAASLVLQQLGHGIILNHLGENVATREEAARTRDSYIEMIHALESAGLRGNISIKPTQLGLDLGRDLCQSLAIEIAQEAKRLGRTIEVDMENSAYTGVTLDIFEEMQRKTGNVGLAVQAYLRRTEADLERLAPLSPKIRLVKGAYREPARVAFQKKSEVDENYRRLLDLLLAPAGQHRFFAAIGTHDPAMVEYACKKIEQNALGKDRYEFQMIYGIRRDLQQQLLAQGHPMQIYVPFGTDWCPYFMRRLAERPANCWFVLRNLFAERKPAASR